jgi:PBP1b-binding outer membrane lipoprotein LpoB
MRRFRMKKKIIGSILLFMILFAGAWKLEHANKRLFFQLDPHVVEALPITNINTPLNEISYEIFKPREYVRIIRITGEMYDK